MRIQNTVGEMCYTDELSLWYLKHYLKQVIFC